MSDTYCAVELGDMPENEETAAKFRPHARTAVQRGLRRKRLDEFARLSEGFEDFNGRRCFVVRAVI